MDANHVARPGRSVDPMSAVFDLRFGLAVRDRGGLLGHDGAVDGSSVFVGHLAGENATAVRTRFPALGAPEGTPAA